MPNSQRSSRPSRTRTSSNGSGKNSMRSLYKVRIKNKSSRKSKSFKYAIIPHLVLMFLDKRWQIWDIAYRIPDIKWSTTEKLCEGVKGILVNGPDHIPYFIREKHYRKKKNGEPDYPLYDRGILMLAPNITTLMFIPDSPFTFGAYGYCKDLPPEVQENVGDILVKTYLKWLRELPRTAEGDYINTQCTIRNLGATIQTLQVQENDQKETIQSLNEKIKTQEADNQHSQGTINWLNRRIKRREKKLDETKKKAETDLQTQSEINSKQVEDFQKQNKDNAKKQNYMKFALGFLTVCTIVFVVLFLVSGFGYISFISKECPASSALSQLHDSTDVPENGNISVVPPGGAGSNGKPSTTTPAALTTTITKAYPPLTIAPRVPIVSLVKPTFEIVSALFQLTIYSANPPVPTSALVAYEMSMSSKTEKIQLRCAVQSISRITVRNANGGLINNTNEKDKQSQLLTITFSQPLDKGRFSLEINYIPSNGAFDQSSFSCGLKKCYVLVTEKLSLLVPHFDYSMKHPWSLEVTHPTNIRVVTNSKAMTSSTSDSTTNIVFQKTVPLLPSELSIVITENLKQASIGQQVESFMSVETTKNEVTGLVDPLNKALQGQTTSVKPKEMFYIVVVSALENYEFNGRNVALVGTSLLRSNEETKMDFVWRWIYRSIIYDKVTSSDGNPTWVYEQSAFFLSTVIKSNNSKLWKKHLYELAMEGGLSDMQPPVNPSITYEDEQRYLDKPQHFAKVSTILGMLTGLGVAVSGDPLTNLDANRDQSTSGRFFFLKSNLKFENDETIDVDLVATCYIDSPDVPFVLIIRTDPSTVTIQRPNGGSTNRCDTHLWFVRDTSKTTREHKLLSDKADNVQIQTNSVILLSGDSPLSAYGYSMDQKEFDKLLDSNVLVSFDASSVNLLAFNAFQAAAEGTLTYESLQRFMKIVLPQNTVSADEAVDLWMGTVIHSRNDTLISRLTIPIVKSVLKASGDTSTKVADYMAARLDRSLKQAPLFEIQKALSLIRKCGDPCFSQVTSAHYNSLRCAKGKVPNCEYDSNILDIYVCSRAVLGEKTEYDDMVASYRNCTGKACLLPILRGLMCTSDTSQINSWLCETTTMDTTSMVNKQALQAIVNGLASNLVAKPLLFPFLLDNWHLLYQKHSKSPELLGDVVNALASSISTSEQLEQYKQFLNYYGQDLDMFREFKDQSIKAQKAVKWNAKYSDVFYKMFEGFMTSN